MTVDEYQLVHANIATPRAPLDDPLMKGFVKRIDEIDYLAQGWHGFIAQPTLLDEGAIYSEPTPPDLPAYVLYWSPSGEVPTEKEIQQRRNHLHRHGATPLAFTFDEPYTIVEMLEFTGEAKNPGAT